MTVTSALKLPEVIGGASQTVDQHKTDAGFRWPEVFERMGKSHGGPREHVPTPSSQ